MIAVVLLCTQLQYTNDPCLEPLLHDAYSSFGAFFPTHPYLGEVVAAMTPRARYYLHLLETSGALLPIKEVFRRALGFFHVQPVQD